MSFWEAPLSMAGFPSSVPPVAISVLNELMNANPSLPSLPASALNGAVVRAGQKFGIQSPINCWLDETLQQIVAGELPIQTYAHQPEKLIAALAASGDDAKRYPK